LICLVSGSSTAWAQSVPPWEGSNNSDIAGASKAIGCPSSVAAPWYVEGSKDAPYMIFRSVKSVQGHQAQGTDNVWYRICNERGPEAKGSSSTAIVSIQWEPGKTNLLNFHSLSPQTCFDVHGAHTIAMQKSKETTAVAYGYYCALPVSGQ